MTVDWSGPLTAGPPDPDRPDSDPAIPDWPADGQRQDVAPDPRRNPMSNSTIAMICLAGLTAICLLGIFFGGLDDAAPAWAFAGIGAGAIAGILAPQPRS